MVFKFDYLYLNFICMDKIGKFLEIVRRLKAERPAFFVWLGTRSWVLTALSGVMLLLSIFGVYTAPEWVDTLLAALTSLFAGAGATTLVTVKDQAKAGVPQDDGPGPGSEPVKPPIKPGKP